MNAPAGPPAWIRELLARARAMRPDPRLSVVRVQVEVPQADPLEWLSSCSGCARGYWADRDGQLEVAAAGEAEEIKGDRPQAYADACAMLTARLQRASDGVRYFGGFRFGPWHERDGAWRPFGAFRFLLPRVEVGRTAGASWAAANLRPDFWSSELDDLARVLGHVSASASGGGALPRTLLRRDVPSGWGWRRQVRRALREIEAGTLRKVVLARRAGLLLDRPVDAVDVLRGLQREVGRGFQFCGSHASGLAFIGISPERLYRREGRRLWSDAVAGTASRGNGPVEEAALAAALQASGKERAEHALVVERLRAELRKLGTQVHVDAEPSILPLGRVQHLHTRLEAELSEGVDDAALLAALHPTPATAGEPVAAALDFLREVESFDRGWYAGPVGWMARDAAEFAVALRSGVLLGRRAGVFAGAGIVPGSDPAREEAEVEAKMGPFLRLLGAV